ncbi:MAG: hypothetical protein QNJ30_06605 [Kiloniellales bacterium]|nr:hypothetical protein [Kiloniellales bacterium]
MRRATGLIDTASQTASFMLGGLVIAAALVVMATSTSLDDITSWAWDVLGLTFAGVLASLVFAALFCWVKVCQAKRAGTALQPWLTAGVQSANGIATLALTYTLLGISLGIGSLAGQELTPETIQVVIRGLTENFSMAFMTTVVGLPTSAFLRSLLLIAGTRSEPTSAGREAEASRREEIAS